MPTGRQVAETHSCPLELLWHKVHKAIGSRQQQQQAATSRAQGLHLKSEDWLDRAWCRWDPRMDSWSLLQGGEMGAEPSPEASVWTRISSTRPPPALVLHVALGSACWHTRGVLLSAAGVGVCRAGQRAEVLLGGPGSCAGSEEANLHAWLRRAARVDADPR